ncbi:MAG TPA: sigma 54-interacting transcriptional regulator [Gemmatimonadaceae bacterium]|nr:sigma 54-interacting transcriptional regulator [Gemmatimonadaceae bacterium]
MATDLGTSQGTAYGSATPSGPSARLEMLRRVTRSLAAAPDLSVVLGSITSALVEHAGAALARVALYLGDDECDICRTRGPVGTHRSEGAKCLHHLAPSSGIVMDPAGPDHLLPLTIPSLPGRVARERRPWFSNDLMRDVAGDLTPEEIARLLELGFVSIGGYPLEFRGELLGVIGILGRQPFEPQAFELLAIFADQAAMAIKSAYLFRELQQYKDRLQVENAYLQEEIRAERGFEEIIGQSPALKAVLRKVKQVAGVDTTVLLTGETGTGKELIARAIHALSPRSDRPMIKVNCGAIPQGIVESELFGHERGAFTGALQRRIGRFELADTGTLFMDEVGELPLDTQIKLLRVLQEQEFERVGGTRALKVDARLVAATNREPEKEVAEGRFRADLFYRLNVFPIRVPPLRERPGDIPLLVRYFLSHFRRKLGKPLEGMTRESLERLQRYEWPGNIRELQNVIERACVLARGPVVGVTDALRAPGDAAVVREGGDAGGDAEPILTLEESERAHIRRALAETGGKIHGPDGAAALLDVNGSTLRSRMQRLGVEKHVS